MQAETPLLTDFYQLAMLQAYFHEAMRGRAVFEFFVRRLPPERNFLVAAGLEQALDYLEGLRFSADDLGYLARDGRFSPEFIEHLHAFSFNGDVEAMPEGTAFFAEEPILRVTASLPEAQLIETRLINILHMQTLIASKAARVVIAAEGKQLVDFGLRRAHGAEAGLFAARASYVAGFTGSATVLAGKRYGVPTFGTMAHSYIQAHDDETAAFTAFARSYRGPVTLLIDTYDVAQGAERAASTAVRLREQGKRVAAVRIDSGDLALGARRVRAILNEHGCEDVGIFLSGNLDEYSIKDLREAGAPADGFGVGTHLDVSTDVPHLDCVYKLQVYEGRSTRKRSIGKSTWPGCKQIYRKRSAAGYLDHDVVALVDDPHPGEAMLAPVMRAGRRISDSPSLGEIRSHAARELASLPRALRELTPQRVECVTIAESVRRLAREVDEEIDRRPEPGCR